MQQGYSIVVSLFEELSAAMNIVTYNSALNDDENEWIDIILGAENKYTEMLKIQIKNAKITREYTDYYIFLNFDVPEALCCLPVFKDRVPVEALVQHIAVDGRTLGIIYHSFLLRSNMEVLRSADGLEPTAFMLHIFKGSVQQLEIYNLDSSLIQRNKISLGRVDYRISPDLVQGR